MKNKLIALIMAILISTLCCACGKDDSKGAQATYNPMDKSNNASSDGDNSDAWWQQYTTEPNGSGSGSSGTTKKQSATTTKKGSSSSKTTAKNSDTKTTASSGSGDNTGYTKVDSNTMKFDVSDGKNFGVVTLSKSSSNQYIKQSVDAANTAFATSYSTSNSMCYSSTMPDMKGINIVYIFGSSNKTKDTLKLVVRIENGSPVAFVTVTSDSENIPFYFWPCATSGNDKYNEYRETFKTAVDSKATAGKFDKMTNSFKEPLNDEYVQEFLKW